MNNFLDIFLNINFDTVSSVVGYPEALIFLRKKGVKSWDRKIFYSVLLRLKLYSL